MRLPSPMPGFGPRESPERPSRPVRTALRGVEDLFLMWTKPCDLLRFGVGVLLLIAVRLPFGSLAIVPGFVEYQPGFALVPFLGAAWGAAGCWAALVASLIGERWLDLSEALVWPRAVGMFLAARCGQRLLHAGRSGAEARPLRIVALDFFRCIPSACAAALSVGAAAGASHYYPFIYVAACALAGHLFFLAVFVPALSTAWRSDQARSGRLGIWFRPGPPARTAAAWGRRLIWLGGAGGWVAAWAISGWVDGIWPGTLYVLGTVDGGRAEWVAVVFLLVLAVGVFWPAPSRGCETACNAA